MDEMGKNSHSDNRGVSRRAALKGALISAAGLASLSLTGVAPQRAVAEEKVKNPTVRDHVAVVPEDSQWAMPDYVASPDKELSADMVIVGSGMGGFAAALTAQENGISNIIMLEKCDQLGGNTAMAEGLTGIQTKWLQDAGYTDLNPDVILQKEYDWHHYICDSTLWRAVLKNNPEDFQWMLDQGVEIVGCVATGGAEYPTHHIYKEHRGHTAIEAFRKIAEDQRGMKIMRNTRATHMLMDDRTVVGIQCLTNGGTSINIHTPIVVLATGGAGANRDIVDYWSDRNSDNQVWLGSPYITGDGIMLAVEAGMGKPYHLGGPGLGATVEPLDIKSHFSCAAALESCDMWINQDGVRFFNEGTTLSFYAPVNAIESQCYTYSVFDQGVMDHYINDGCDVGWAQYVKRGTKLVNAPAECERELAAGNPYVFKADTVEELFSQMGVPVDQAMATLEEYNGYCRAGEDAAFFKDAKYLKEIKTPPFYGARLKAGVVSQKGGIHCNSKGEVITLQNDRINGLYVAGLDCGGFQSQTTGITIPGSVQAYALGMGRLCGKNAAQYIKNA